MPGWMAYTPPDPHYFGCPQLAYSWWDSLCGVPMNEISRSLNCSGMPGHTFYTASSNPFSSHIGARGPGATVSVEV
eukprot:1162019-Pelagomonas_calceolata.AAC.9